MKQISKQRIDDLFMRFKDIKIAVIGDIMLDTYYWGETKRISPEAPVPVVDIYKEDFDLGGAANVALNIKTLSAKSSMIGVIGNDDAGQKILENFSSKGIETYGIIKDENRVTTVKTRVLAAGQHVVRFDNEVKDDISFDTQQKIIDHFSEIVDNIDGLILEDYNKGVLTPSLIEKIIEIAVEHNKIITVDPKFKNYKSYMNSTLFKPNLKEAEMILKRKIRTDKELGIAGNELLEILNVKYLVITLNSRGMALFQKNVKMKIIPAKTVNISNVSGAGDTVIANLTVALAAGALFEEACTIANYAASIAVEDVGVISVAKDMIYKRLLDENVIVVD